MKRMTRLLSFAGLLLIFCCYKLPYVKKDLALEGMVNTGPASGSALVDFEKKAENLGSEDGVNEFGFAESEDQSGPKLMPIKFNYWGSVALISGSDALFGNQSLKANTMSGGVEWNDFLNVGEGFFKKGVTYDVSFRYKIVELEDDAGAYVIVRSPTLGYSADIVNSVFKGKPGQEGIRRFSFTSKDVDDFKIHIGMKNKGIVILDDIKISFGVTTMTVAIQPGVKPVTKKTLVPPLPIEFTPDEPKPSKEYTVNVADFGASTALRDNTAAFKNAIKSAISNQASRFVIPKGVYRFEPADYTPIRFSDLTDCVIEGNGSELINSKPFTFIGLYNCTRVVVKNLIVDWDWSAGRIASVFKVTARENDHIVIDFLFDNQTPDKLNWKVVTKVDPEFYSAGTENSLELFGNPVLSQLRFERTGPTTFKVYPPSGKMGELNLTQDSFYRIHHYTYEAPAFHSANLKHVSFQDITIYSHPGMGMVFTEDNQYIELKRINVIRRPGEEKRRFITTAADIIHFGQSMGFIKIEDCEFSYAGDDCINIHDNTSRGFVRRSENSINAIKLAGWHDFFYPGDVIEFRNTDLSPTGVKAKLSKVEWAENKGTCIMVFEENLPKDLSPESLIWNTRYTTTNVIIRKNRFHDNRTRGLLVHFSDGLVENNHFYRLDGAAIQIETGYAEAWSEGMGVNNVTFRDNLIENCDKGERGHGAIYSAGYLPGNEKAAYPIIRNLLFERNTIRNPSGIGFMMYSTYGVVIRENNFTCDKGLKTIPNFRNNLTFKDCANITVINNKFGKNSLQPMPAIQYDSETVKEVTIEGNTTIEK